MWIYFTKSFTVCENLNFGALCAGIVNASPVCKFLPALSSTSLTENVPNPNIDTSIPSTRASLIISTHL